MKPNEFSLSNTDRNKRMISAEIDKNPLDFIKTLKIEF